MNNTEIIKIITFVKANNNNVNYLQVITITYLLTIIKYT